MNGSAYLPGTRILVVEDESIVAMSIQDVLADMQCIVIGPAARLDAALHLAAEERLDGAVLDVNIRGKLVFPVAAALDTRQVPFLFVTGYGPGVLVPPYEKRRTVPKPFAPISLKRAIAETIFGKLAS